MTLRSLRLDIKVIKYKRNAHGKGKYSENPEQCCHCGVGLDGGKMSYLPGFQCSSQPNARQLGTHRIEKK